MKIFSLKYRFNNEPLLTRIERDALRLLNTSVPLGEIIAELHDENCQSDVRIALAIDGHVEGCVYFEDTNLPKMFLMHQGLTPRFLKYATAHHVRELFYPPDGKIFGWTPNSARGTHALYMRLGIPATGRPIRGFPNHTEFEFNFAILERACELWPHRFERPAPKVPNHVSVL